MKEFSFSTRIFFGENSLDRLKEVKNKRVFIITDHFISSSGIADRVASHLENCKITIFSEVMPDPTLEVVTEGVKHLLTSQAEVMIAVGGGSVIDAAKAIRAIGGQMEHPSEIMECFAIPTTSGTGSEVTEYAVISDAKTGTKYPLTSSALRPPVAILDPSLVITAPPSVTSHSGMDVLTHALEAYVSLDANDFSDALCEKTVSLVFKWLPEAFNDGKNLLAREEMHNASCLAGLAFNSAGLGVCHGLSHAIGGKLHLPHGMTNAIVLPHVLRYNADFDHSRSGVFNLTAHKYQRMAKLLDLPSSSIIVGVSQLVRGVEQLNKKFKIPSTLKGAGCDMDYYHSMHNEIIETALADVTTSTNPRKVSEADVQKLLIAIAG